MVFDTNDLRIGQEEKMFPTRVIADEDSTSSKLPTLQYHQRTVCYEHVLHRQCVIRINGGKGGNHKFGKFFVIQLRKSA